MDYRLFHYGHDGEGQPAKRSKVAAVPVHRSSHGIAPKEYLDKNKATIVFDVHNFAVLEEKRDACIVSKTAQVFGYPFRVCVYPRGDRISKADVEHVSLDLQFMGENTESNPVFAKTQFISKTISSSLEVHDFKNNEDWGYTNFCKRSEVIEEELDKDGTFTVKVDITIGTEKKKVWYPKLTTPDPYRTRQYESTSYSDVTFVVGTSRKEFLGHKWIIELRASLLHEIIITDEEDPNTTRVELSNMNENVFEMFFLFIYKDDAPIITGDEEQAKQLLLAADRFGCTNLKLYMESMMVETFVSSSNVIDLLMIGDSFSCALLKETCMNFYMENPTIVQEESKPDWTRLTESTSLLLELLNYATSGRKMCMPLQYYKSNSAGKRGSCFMHPGDYLDVTSLRERLELLNFDVDGSREMLVQRWNGRIVWNEEQWALASIYKEIYE